MQAVTRSALTPVRSAAAHEAEQVSQALLGEVVDVLETGVSWLRCRGEDGLEGWLNAGAMMEALSGAGAWWDVDGAEEAVALDAVIVAPATSVLVRLPWGARLSLRGDEVRLPDGRRGLVAEGRLVRDVERPALFPADGSSVVRTALQWLGVPYLWGGRTRWGADCSGFVQAVHRLHGLPLPRDSYLQATVGLAVPGVAGAGVAGDLDALEAGDLCFFRARDRERIVHVAISLGGPIILHAAERNGAVRENDLRGGDELERSLAGRLSVVRRPFAPGWMRDASGPEPGGVGQARS